MSIEEKIVFAASSLNLHDVEAAAIQRALELNGGNMVRTASALGIDRRTLYRKCAKYKIEHQLLRDAGARTGRLDVTKGNLANAPRELPVPTREPSTFSGRDEPGIGGTGVEGYW